ncbi:hypothetical protein ALQ79_200518 [Pseudomonas amygdali pv. lachrymans]|nr:hypothetical protein ALQ79_200518 [Pseudomonas amygdali pv. lachrymans]
MRRAADRAGLFLLLSGAVVLLMSVLLMPGLDKSDVPAILLLGMVCGAIGTLIFVATEEPKCCVWIGKQESGGLGHSPIVEPRAVCASSSTPESRD